MGVAESCTAGPWEESEWDRERHGAHRVRDKVRDPGVRGPQRLRRAAEPAAPGGHAIWSARSLPALAKRPTVAATAGPREHRPLRHAAAGNPSDKSDWSDPTRCFEITARQDHRSLTCGRRPPGRAKLLPKKPAISAVSSLPAIAERPPVAATAGQSPAGLARPGLSEGSGESPRSPRAGVPGAASPRLPFGMLRSLIRPAELRLLPEASLVWNS
jgi:hypothetical protein